MKAASYLLLLVLLAAACGKQASAPSSQPAVPERAVQPIEVVDVAPPKLGKSEAEEPGEVVRYAQSLFRKPPFYPGEMPLKYTSTRRPSGGPYGMNELVLSDQFGGWRNDYVYEDSRHQIMGIADGARAIDDHGKILAEARLSKEAFGKTLEVEEFHYTNGKVHFYCKSLFTMDGMKQSENDKRGKKGQEFFFLWPTGSSF